MSTPAPAPITPTILDEVIAARKPWGWRVQKGQVLRITDLEGQQAVDFLCYDAADPGERYSATNTLKVQGRIFIEKGTVLYSDGGHPLMTVVADTVGRHDTIYGCCSNPNNLLRYGVRTTESCYSNFERILSTFGLDRSAIVSNINFFMCVPVEPDGRAGVATSELQPGSYVELRAERDVIAVLSNCPQMHNPCNGYNPTPIRVSIFRVPDTEGR
jgi:urea carboxylase-associated protein 1